MRRRQITVSSMLTKIAEIANIDSSLDVYSQEITPSMNSLKFAVDKLNSAQSALGAYFTKKSLVVSDELAKGNVGFTTDPGNTEIDSIIDTEIPEIYILSEYEISWMEAIGISFIKSANGDRDESDALIGRGIRTYLSGYYLSTDLIINDKLELYVKETGVNKIYIIYKPSIGSMIFENNENKFMIDDVEEQWLVLTAGIDLMQKYNKIAPPMHLEELQTIDNALRRRIGAYNSIVKKYS